MTQGYKQRTFNESPLFQVVHRHFGDFREAYHREYSDKMGSFRHIITHTANRFLACGDPREGIARYECPRCKTTVAVPFSCKTRLFCPSCHEIKILLWFEEIRTHLLLPVAHRFWTSSIPKRLRTYFLRNRKLLSLLVAAASNTLSKSLSGGKIVPGFKPGIVSLIQTHSDDMRWNCHLHMIVTDGAVDYSDVADIKFKPCKFWNFEAMTEIFRFEVIGAMFKKGVLAPDVADNLAEWKNSGFHVHASSPFMPDEGDILKTRLAYAFRPAVTLNRMAFDGKTVTVTTRKQTLRLAPVEFLARLTLHIPDRYQNIRRYAGFYASIVQCKVRKVASRQIDIHETSLVKPNWAALIARIFGEAPIACPNCGAAMDLKEFVVSAIPIARLFPEIARAPPRVEFGRYVPPSDGLVYGCPENEPADAGFNQLPPNDDAVFNQESAW